MQFNNDESKVLTEGDSFSAYPVDNHYLFIAEEETNFIYVTSRPVFHHYSKISKELMDLAIAIEEKDGYTAEHCHRITKLSMLVGEKMGLSKGEIIDLNFGSFLHDIGKTKIPISILRKPAKLTNFEWIEMKKHPIYGYEILRNTGISHFVSAAKIIEQHHERFDGSGYPYQLKGEEILIGAAIVAVVDSYDAMTTDRVYQTARTKVEALAEIKRCKGTLYHPDVVDIFLSLEIK